MVAGMVIAPNGYLLVKDEALGSFLTPVGYRLIKKARGRARVVGKDFSGTVRPDLTNPREWHAKLEEFLAKMRSTHLPGTFLKWGEGRSVPLRVLAEFQEDRRWLYLRPHTGFLRLADAPLPADTRWDAMKPGEFILETKETRTRTWGFSSTEHHGYGRPVKVRMPEILLGGEEVAK